MNKNVLVVTGYTDDFRQKEIPDNTMAEVFDLTLISKQKYVKKHGYDLLTLRSFGQDENKIFNTSEYPFIRVSRCMEMLKYYDVVMWLDADSLITNDAYKIEDFGIDNNFCFYASYAWISKDIFSTGNFILKNTNVTQDFCKFFHQIAKKFPDEQETLNAIYKYTNFRNNMKVLENKYFDSIPTPEMYTKEVWTTRPRPEFPWTSDSFIVHLTGVYNKNRIKIISDYFGDFI